MRVLLLAFVALWFVGAPSHRAGASCNAIPEQPIMFRGERGGIDRPYLSPDSDEVVTLRSFPGSETAQGAKPEDFLITFIFKPPAQEPRTFFIAGDDHCKPFEERACFLKRLLCCHAPRTCVTGTAVGLKVGAASGLSQLSFRFPQFGAAGPVTVAVATRDRAGHLTPPSGLQKHTCADFVASTAAPNLSICIDTFRPPEADPPGDPVFTQLVALPPSYDYSTVCTHSIDDPNDPKCAGTDKDVKYTVDSEGDVLFSINWRKILLKGGGPNLAQREVRASTAVEAVLGQNKLIVIPSAVFLETTTQQGGGFTPSPVFQPVDLADRPYEQTVLGTADKGKSVLTFKRRVLWDHTCTAAGKTGQACEPGWANSDCPSVQCLPSAAGYFACAGGDRNRLPCTRTEQCLPGTCLRVSATGSVCYSLNGTSISPEKACTQDSDCGTDAECGPGLFEFRNRTVNGIGTLTRKATNTRGVCDSGLDEGNLCTTAAACSSSFFTSVDCVTYRAEALKFSP
jgi:hypothetical protein